MSVVQGVVPMLEKYPIVDIRGRGLMSAIEFGGRNGSLNSEYGTASKVVKACGDRGLLILSAGMLTAPVWCAHRWWNEMINLKCQRPPVVC